MSTTPTSIRALAEAHVKSIFGEDPSSHGNYPLACEADFLAGAEAALSLPEIRAMRDFIDNTLATLECNSRQRNLPEDDWEHARIRTALWAQNKAGE